MRSAYVDCIGGIAGDMLLAALVDAGGDRDVLAQLPQQLGIEDVEIRVEDVERAGLRALHVRVVSDGDARLTWPRIRSIVTEAGLPPAVKERALAVLTRLADAEAHVHGVSRDDVHFHELGSVDTLIDVFGAVCLLSDLGVDRIVCSPLPLARGFVDTAHGTFPLPAPATAELLRGASVVGSDEGFETVTPTGAALVAVLAESFGPLPPLVLQDIGYGAGTVDRPGRPNVVRVLLGTAQDAPAVGVVSLVETNLDDANPEFVPDAVERCFTAGAVDVWTTPVQMKKGRPGVVISALARPASEASVARALLEETTAIGVRVSRLHRYELEREDRTVAVEGGTVRVKVAYLDGRIVNVAPEHDDCVALARATGQSVKSVWTDALAAAGKL
jgi:pyridinium-3,5-bisthiocarboxylic acid mononucleotide nickel chelatase